MYKYLLLFTRTVNEILRVRNFHFSGISISSAPFHFVFVFIFFTKIYGTIPGIEKIHLQYYDAGDKFLIDVNDMDEEHLTDEICVMKNPCVKNRVTGHCTFR